MEGVVRPLWRDAVLDPGPKGKPRVNRITYEICVLEALREQLRCKEIWVVGADRYRNPDEDLPADFEAGATPYYTGARACRSTPIRSLPVCKRRCARACHARCRPATQSVRADQPEPWRGWITLSPLRARPDPANIDAVKAEVDGTGR